MQHLFDNLAGVAAAVLGWVFVSLPRVVRRQTTWILVLSSVGLAAVVGLASWSLLKYLVPAMPENLLCAICAVVGGRCEHWFNRYSAALDKAADRAESRALDADIPDTKGDL